MEPIEYEDGLYVLYFPLEITGVREMEICYWIGNCPTAKVSDSRPFIEFDDEETALLFRLKFGI